MSFFPEQTKQDQAMNDWIRSKVKRRSVTINKPITSEQMNAEIRKAAGENTFTTPVETLFEDTKKGAKNA